jgi:chemotaxis protein methyltransferase CheR
MGLADASGLPPSEWHHLLTQLTVNESYFFRDRNQFQLIAQRLLPEIIARKQQQQRTTASGRPRLRIWSAGCSTGEELYSIAIALAELNFPWSEWDTLLIGTDISMKALTTAQLGLYGNWSFRQTDPTLQQKYFRPQRQLLRIREDIHQRVTFQYSNLVQAHDASTSTLLREMDLILCRNVFIYFDDQAIARTLTKFRQSLACEGYLITGHTELYGQDVGQFQLQVFPESLVYQRPPTAPFSTVSPGQPKPAAPGGQTSRMMRKPSARPLPQCTLPSPPLRPRSQPQSPPVQGQPTPAARSTMAAEAISETAIAAAKTSLLNKDYAQAIVQAQQICTQAPHSFEAHVILARAYANMGQHHPAKDTCKRALSLEPLNVELHYLLAQIAEEEGELDLAREHLRRIIYIDNYEFQAYLDLASLYQQERRIDQVIKMERLALKTLNLLPEKTIVNPETGATVADWRQRLEAKLAFSLPTPESSPPPPA